jgi:hypothetical protein
MLRHIERVCGERRREGENRVLSGEVLTTLAAGGTGHLSVPRCIIGPTGRLVVSGAGGTLRLYG